MGFRGKYKNKRDANEQAIKDELEARGISVFPMDKPVDLLCGYGDYNHLVEVKSPSGTLTGPQKIFTDYWPTPVIILRSTDDAAEWANEIRGKK